MNRLSNEKSPYLLQHSNNPVDWYPWGEEAFEKARRENKPVLLSIGYSTCHWCHVMEKESFEDEEVAALMNDAFVSIKVDREERPDIDNIYMTVCQMLTGSGGWPLTIFLTPDKQPFFAGTYIPKHDRFGRPGMLEMIPRLKELWKLKQQDLARSAAEITQALQQATPKSSEEILDSSALRAGFEQLSRRFDRVFGGFGDAPKFPTPHQLMFLLRYWKRTNDARGAGDGGKDFTCNAAGWDLRSHWFWISPVFDRSRVARASFRKNALRSGPAQHDLHRGLSSNTR